MVVPTGIVGSLRGIEQEVIDDAERVGEGIGIERDFRSPLSDPNLEREMRYRIHFQDEATLILLVSVYYAMIGL